MAVQPDLIEVVYWRHMCRYVEVCDSVEDALAYIEQGEDFGAMSSVGVFRNAEPIVWDGFVEQDPPTLEQARVMREHYSAAQRD